MRTCAGLMAGRAGAISRWELLAQPPSNKTASNPTTETRFICNKEVFLLFGLQGNEPFHLIRSPRLYSRASLVGARESSGARMKKENWQRLKNLALFKIWATDREMRRIW